MWVSAFHAYVWTWARGAHYTLRRVNYSSLTCTLTPKAAGITYRLILCSARDWAREDLHGYHSCLSSSILWPFMHRRSITVRYSLLSKQGNRRQLTGVIADISQADFWGSQQSFWLQNTEETCTRNLEHIFLLSVCCETSRQNTRQTLYFVCCWTNWEKKVWLSDKTLICCQLQDIMLDFAQI